FRSSPCFLKMPRRSPTLTGMIGSAFGADLPTVSVVSATAAWPPMVNPTAIANAASERPRHSCLCMVCSCPAFVVAWPGAIGARAMPPIDSIPGRRYGVRHGELRGREGWALRAQVQPGQVLMTLGEPGVVARNDEYHFRSPAGVITAPNGDIFVVDGHGSNNRIVKYSKDGKFIKAWGKTGYAPGEFRTAHCIAMDKRGSLFVCDRSNTRIQIFDQ